MANFAPGEWKWMDSLPGLGQSTPDITPTDDATAQLMLKRKLAMADALRQQETPQGQMVSGHYVAPSWTQYLGNLANKWVGGQQENAAIKGYMDYQTAERQKQQDELRKLGNILAPKRITQEGTYDIQVPNGQTPTPADKMGAMQPYETGMKTISVPMTTTTGYRKPTETEIYQGIADYSNNIKNPALLEKVMMSRLESALAPKKPIELGAGGKLLNPDTYEVLATNPKESAESKSNLEKEYDFMKEHGYKGSAQDYFDMKRSMTDKERNDLDIKLKQLGIDQWNLYYNTGYGNPPKGNQLKQGTIVNGFKYIGGDPNQQSSWSKQ